MLHWNIRFSFHIISSHRSWTILLMSHPREPCFEVRLSGLTFVLGCILPVKYHYFQPHLQQLSSYNKFLFTCDPNPKQIYQLCLPVLHTDHQIQSCNLEKYRELYKFKTGHCLNELLFLFHSYLSVIHAYQLSHGVPNLQHFYPPCLSELQSFLQSLSCSLDNNQSK